MNTSHLRAEVERRYAALDLPAWPAPRPVGAPPANKEYSRVTDPQRYRIAGARARLWAEVLGEAGAAVEPDPVQSIPVGGAPERAEPVHRAVQVAPPAGVTGAAPWWLLESDVPQEDGGVLPLLRVAVGRPDLVHDSLPDCGCDACDGGSADLLEGVDDAIVRAVGAGVTLTGHHGLRRGEWQLRWYASGQAVGSDTPPGWTFDELVRACEQIAQGGRPALPRGTEVSVRATWFPGS